MSTNLSPTISGLESPKTNFVGCECCKMTEEYTSEYIQNVQSLYAGRFICGLCSESVKYEMFKWAMKQRRIGVEEALAIQMKFRSEFLGASRSSDIDFISVMGKIFKRRLVLDLPSVVMSEPVLGSIVAVDGGAVCATAVIGGAGSCLPALSGGV